MKKAIAVLLAAMMLLLTGACGKTNADSPAPDVEEMSVTVVELSGSARILRGDGVAESLEKGSKLAPGDSIITDRDSTVDIQVSGLSSEITISPSSEVLLNTAASEEGGNEFIMVVRKGSVSNSVDIKLEEGDIYEVCTGDMTMAIRGTDALVHCEDGVTSISLLTGYALVYNYADDQIYTVPCGLEGCFSIDGPPKFELIELDGYAEISEAAGRMMERASADDKDFADSFEATLRESYLEADSEYVFSVTEPLTETEEEAEGGNSEAATTTAEPTATTAPSTTAETTTEKTTAKTKPTAPKPTKTTATVPSEPTAPTAPTEPTTPTTPTEPTQPPTQYMYSMAGLALSGGGEIGSVVVKSGFITLPATITTTGTADNGQTFQFSITLTESNISNYMDYGMVFAISGTEGEYSYGSVYTGLSVIVSPGI